MESRGSRAHGRIAGDQIHSLGAEEPGTTHPIAAAVGIVFALQGQRVTHHVIQSALEHTRQARAILWILQFVFEWIDINRESPLLPHVIPGVFVSGQGVFRRNAQPVAQTVQ